MGLETPQPVVVEGRTVCVPKEIQGTLMERRLKEMPGTQTCRQPFWFDSSSLSPSELAFFYFSLGGWEVGRVREWVDGVSEAFRH